MLDAPVSGGTGGRAGRDTHLHGRRQRSGVRAPPRPFPGKDGQDHRARRAAPATARPPKICNNMILGVSMIAVSEAFVLAEKLGLDAAEAVRHFVEVVPGNAGR